MSYKFYETFKGAFCNNKEVTEFEHTVMENDCASSTESFM